MVYGVWALQELGGKFGGVMRFFWGVKWVWIGVLNIRLCFVLF